MFAGRKSVTLLLFIFLLGFVIIAALKNTKMERTYMTMFKHCPNARDSLTGYMFEDGILGIPG